ncbi:MAG: hypothetical protein ABR600_08060 [Actinomycetota bacterium]
MRKSRFRIGVVSVIAVLCLSLAGMALAASASTKLSLSAKRTGGKVAVTIKVSPKQCGANQGVSLKWGSHKAVNVKLDAKGHFSHKYAAPKGTKFTASYKARRVGHHPNFTTCSKAKDSATA